MQKLLCISAWLDRSKVRLNRSNLGQNAFFQQNFNSALAHLKNLGFYVLP